MERNIMPDFAAKFLAQLTWTKVLLGLGLFVGTVVISVAVVAFILVRLPPRYFLPDHCRDWWPDRHPWLRLLGRILKNGIGILCVLAGIVQLVGPGQGILTILIGVMLLDFPGKARLERKLVSRPGVLKAINRLRAHYGRPPLIIEEPPRAGHERVSH
jgi:hypothetical protein